MKFFNFLSLNDGFLVKQEMLAEYRRIHVTSVPPTPQDQQYIDYKKFVEMLQN